MAKITGAFGLKDFDGDGILDFNGPKLITGVRGWLKLYQILGQINWIGLPLYISIIYKLIVFCIVNYTLTTRIMLRLLELQIMNENYKNPIFLFISCLGFISITAQVFVTLRVNMFDLCPLFKMLTTPRLCFVRVQELEKLGSRSLVFILICHVYHTILLSMLVSKDLEDFINNFYLPTFLLDLYTNMVFMYYLVGTSHLDLFIRSAFGHWLLALKSHLEHRFTYLHKHQRIKKRRDRDQLISRLAGDCDVDDVNLYHLQEQQAMKEFNLQQRHFNNLKLITFDEIQKNLNNMDDHLEVLRSIQISSLVLLTLNAFLANGALFLISYHLLADQSNFYHGFILLLIALNTVFIIFISYSGDWWIYYALSSFVQTVEDEYFMQSDIVKTPQPSSIAGTNVVVNASNLLSMSIHSQHRSIQQSATSSTSSLNEAAVTAAAATTTTVSTVDRELDSLDNNIDELTSYQQMLLIKKKDVLFCREFLHQFENHLATPWSKLNFITHLHMARAFVTLIAAQIIFDHEH